jgi:hypothetical protein
MPSILDRRGKAGDLQQCRHNVNDVVELPPWMANERCDRCGVTGKHRFPLGDVTGVEPVKIIKTHASRPLVERSGLAWSGMRMCCVSYRTMRCGTVLLQDTPDRAVFRPHDAIVAGEARRNFRDHAETRRMVWSASVFSTDSRQGKMRVSVCIDVRSPSGAWLRSNSTS